MMRSQRCDIQGRNEMKNDAEHRTKLTPPEIAKQWGIGYGKVMGWIRSGELRAIDVSGRCGGQPRYLVDVADLAAFEERRSNQASRKPTTRRRQPRSMEGVIQFF